jgi:hypothetical protein
VRAVSRRAAVPAFAAIELGDEGEKAIGACVQVAGQLDELILMVIPLD